MSRGGGLSIKSTVTIYPNIKADCTQFFKRITCNPISRHMNCASRSFKITWPSKRVGWGNFVTIDCLSKLLHFFFNIYRNLQASVFGRNRFLLISSSILSVFSLQKYSIMTCINISTAWIASSNHINVSYINPNFHAYLDDADKYRFQVVWTKCRHNMFRHVWIVPSKRINKNFIILPSNPRGVPQLTGDFSRILVSKSGFSTCLYYLWVGGGA